MKKYNPKIGDYVFVTGHQQITEQKWKESFPNNIFGKIIFINQYYSRRTGKKLPLEIVIRVRNKNGRHHSSKEGLKFLEKCIIK